MNPALLVAAIQLLPVLLATIADLIDAVDPGGDGLTAANVAFEVVRGIDRAHHDWSNEQKRAYALDAIRGLVDSDSEANALLELSVQRAKDTPVEREHDYD